MPDSSIGFGHNPWGHHQYGFGDWAEEMLWKNMPEVYKDCDEAGPAGTTVQTPLRKFQNALKASYQDIRVKWEQFPSLWDAIEVPLAQLPQLGYNVGIDVDSTKPETLQRSSVLNASQLWVNKGTDKGYELTAAFEGLLVTISPLWAETCGPSNYVLGTIGTAAASFDLSTTPLVPNPVAPGTVNILVTTKYGTEESLGDDEMGNLVAFGSQMDGPLTRLNLTPATSLALVSISGIFSVGDTVTQGPNTGVILQVVGSQITIQTILGVFSVGPITDTTSGATATVAATFPDVLQANETIVGLTTGTTGLMRDFRTTFSAVDRITTLAGFAAGETLRGLTSGRFAVAGSSAPVVAGPLQWRLNLINVVGAFELDDEVTGTVTGVVAQVCETCPTGTTFVNVELITQPGFLVGENISVGPNTGTIESIEKGTIDYISGAMSGTTVPLLAGSDARLVPKLNTTGPTQFLPKFDEVIGDEIPMDLVESDRYANWPATYYPVRFRSGILTDGECRSYSLRLFFFTPDNTEIENFIDVAARIGLALERFRPLHVRFDKISFDGARASSQVYRTGQVIADSAAASVWTSSVTGLQQASSQVWSSGSFSADVLT